VTASRTGPVPRRRMPRRLLRAAGVAVVTLVALRLAISLALVPAVRSALSSLGFDAEIERIDLSIHEGRVEIGGLALWEKGAPPGSDPLVRLRYAHADLSMGRLFSGRVRLERVEADGVEILLERGPDGRFSIERALAGEGDERSGAGAEPAPDGDTDPVDFLLPFEIAMVRAAPVTIRVLDRSSDSEVDVTLEATIRADDVGSEERPLRAELLASAAGALDRLRATAVARASEGEVSARLRVEARGLSPLAVEPLLRPLGIEAEPGDVAFHFEAEAELCAAGDRRESVAGTITFGDAAVFASGEEAAALDRLAVAIASLGARETAIESVEIEGVRASARRLASGRIAVAGVSFGPVPEDASGVGPAPGGAAESPAGPRAPLVVERVTIAGARLAFRDEAVKPAADLVADLERFSAAPFADHPARRGESTRVEADLRLPGVAETVRLRGDLVPFGEARDARLEIAASDVTLRAIAPYLELAGFVPALERGEIALGVEAGARTDGATGATTASLRRLDLSLVDGAERRLSLGLRADGIEIGPEDGVVRVEEIAVDGPSLPVRRDASGALHVLGLKSVRPEARVRDGEPLPGPAAGAPGARGGGPAGRLEIARLEWTPGAVLFEDEAVDPPVSLSLGETRLTVLGLALPGPDPKAAEPNRATLAFRSSVPGAIEAISLEGDVTTHPGPLKLEADFALRASGVTAWSIAPLLERSGIDVRRLDAAFGARLRAAVAADGGALEASAEIADAVLEGPDGVAASLESLRVGGTRVAPDGAVAVEEIAVRKPFARLARRADGSLVVAGARFLPAPPAGAPEERASVAARAAEAAEPRIRVEKASLESLAVTFADEMSGRAAPLDVRLDAGVERLDLSGGAKAAPFSASLTALGLVDSVSIEGEVSPAPADLRAVARVEARGVRGKGLAAYLPPGLGPRLEDGRLSFRAHASSRERRDGPGRTLALEVADLDYRDGDAEDALLGFSRLAVIASRVDPDAGVFELDEVALAGLSARAARGDDGSIEFLGVVAGGDVGGERARSDETRNDREDNVEGPAPGAEPPELPAGEPRRAGAPPLPSIRVARLDVGVERLVVEAAGGGNDLVASARLRNVEPLALLGPAPESLGPMKLRFRGSAEPLVASISADVEIDPWSSPASAAIDVAVDGIAGPALAEIDPALAERIDAGGIDGGTFRAAITAHADFGRTRAANIDPSRGFGLDLSVRDAELRDAPGGEVLLGVAAIELIAERLVPATGEVRVRELRIERPALRVAQEPDGFRACGVLIRSRAGTAEGSSAPAGGTLAEGSGPGPPEVRVDLLEVQGADFAFTDRTTDPPLVLPIDGLDVSVRGFSTHAAARRSPIAFSVFVDAGDVAFPEGPKPAFQEASLVGRVVPGPAPSGEIRANIGALELRSLAGPASASGLTIEDGVLDARASVVLRGEKGAAVDSRLVFGSLSLEEPSGGPISRILELPASLDTVLFLLRDANEEHRFELDFTVPPGGLGTGAIVARALSTLSEAIAKAVAASPFRVTGAVTDLLGMTGGPEEATGPAAEIAFSAGDASLSAEAESVLGGVLERLDDDDTLTVVMRHELGPGDSAAVRSRANPDARHVREIVDRLGRERGAIDRRRDEAAAEARALFGTARAIEAEEAAARVRSVEAERAENRARIDAVLPLLFARGDRLRDARARAAARDLGTARLAAVRDALFLSGVSEIAERVGVRPARGGLAGSEGRGRVLLEEKRRPPKEGFVSSVIGALMFWTWL